MGARRGKQSTLPRANKLRIAGPRALPRKTTEREKALVTIEVIRQWNE